MRYKNGCINLEPVNCSAGVTATIPNSVRIIPDTNLVEVEGRIYYDKICGLDFYGELLAEEIAHDLNIPCAHYDLAFYNENFHLLSEVKDTVNTYLVEDILKNYYNVSDTKEYTNLIDIKKAIAGSFHGYDLSSVEVEFNRIYLFDILIANPDRNATNLKITTDGDEIHFMPLFDNQNAFSNDDTTYDSNYTLGVKHEKEHASDLQDFLIEYSYMIPILENSLTVIDPHRIQEAFYKIEMRIGEKVPDQIVRRYINAACDNQEMIHRTIDEVKEKEKIK